MKGSPADPNRLYASQSSGWFGQILQRSDDGGRSWQPMDNGFVYDGVPARTRGTTARPIRGSSRASGISNPRSTIPTSSTPASKMRHSFARATAERTGTNSPALRRHARLRAGSPERRRHVSAHDSARPASSSTDVCSDLGCGCVSQRRWRRELAADQSRLKSNSIPDPKAEVGHCVHRIAMHPSRPERSSCRSTGTSCAATTAAKTGPRSAATFPPISASLSTSTRTSPRRSMWCRSRATPNTFRSTAICASIAAAPAATSGRR